jgi:hypothetical protein
MGGEPPPLLSPSPPFSRKDWDSAIDPPVAVSIIRPSLSVDIWRAEFRGTIRFGQDVYPGSPTSEKTNHESGAVVRSIHTARDISCFK